MNGLEASAQKMREEGIAEPAIDAFTHYYRMLSEGQSGMLAESDIEPLEDLPDADALTDVAGPELLDRVVVLKLNGGLGTSMGMNGPKSLLEVKDGLTFLDVIAHQLIEMRRRSGARLPLVLMNSFATREASLAALERYPELRGDVPLDFLQGKVPKLLAEDLTPVEWPREPALEWAPPGHGDLYTSLVTSGMLDELLEHGYEYAFVSNVDNLGAVLEPRILAWFASEGLPFAMEAPDRTEADRKGGHPARLRASGDMVLREKAQTPAEDLGALQDTARHRYFNANNLWLSLSSLRETLSERDEVLGLPMIVNRKTVDPGDPSSPEVIQLETAMGAAIGVFEGAAAVRVPRQRFTPVKTTNDLLVLRSDAYEIADGGEVRLAAPEVPFVDLDPDHFQMLSDFDARFANGPPSLVGARRLGVHGDVAFGREVTVRGEVTIENDGHGQTQIEDGAVLEG
jgi:UTP--glucose-1-phosphate uridylyltransferase